MIMGGDSKKIATMIVDRFDAGKDANKKAFEERAGEKDPEEYSGLEACAEEIIAAIHAKDAKALAKALADFDEIHDAHEEGESEEEETAEHPILG